MKNEIKQILKITFINTAVKFPIIQKRSILFAKGTQKIKGIQKKAGMAKINILKIVEDREKSYLGPKINFRKGEKKYIINAIKHEQRNTVIIKIICFVF